MSAGVKTLDEKMLSGSSATDLSLSTLFASRGRCSFNLGLDAGAVGFLKDKTVLGVTTGVLLDSGSTKGVNCKARIVFSWTVDVNEA